jgi:hypothetical protein
MTGLEIVAHVAELLGIAILIYFGKSFLGQYTAQKGRNLATKEDIAEITKKIEEVRSYYAERLEKLSFTNRLRLAALDRRLETHQKAYTLWRDLLHSVYDQQAIGEKVLFCQKWWEENCIYLEKEAREGFYRAYIAAHGHHQLIDSHTNAEAVKASWAVIKNAGDEILRSVELPPIAEGESNVLSKK